MVGRRDPFSSISTTGRGGGQKQGAKPEPTSVPAVDNAYETTIAEKRDRDRKRRVDLLGRGGSKRVRRPICRRVDQGSEPITYTPAQSGN